MKKLDGLSGTRSKIIPMSENQFPLLTVEKTVKISLCFLLDKKL